MPDAVRSGALELGRTRRVVGERSACFGRRFACAAVLIVPLLGTIAARPGPQLVWNATANIADILVDPEGALERRNHWEKTSHSLLVGAILHVLYAEEEKTLARVATVLSDPSVQHWGDPTRPQMAKNRNPPPAASTE